MIERKQLHAAIEQSDYFQFHDITSNVRYVGISIMNIRWYDPHQIRTYIKMIQADYLQRHNQTIHMHWISDCLLSSAQFESIVTRGSRQRRSTDLAENENNTDHMMAPVNHLGGGVSSSYPLPTNHCRRQGCYRAPLHETRLKYNNNSILTRHEHAYCGNRRSRRRSCDHER